MTDQATALTPEEQKEYTARLQDHVYIIYNAPCWKFDGYPSFPWNNEDGTVYIRAVVERFDLNERTALTAKFNSMIKKSKEYQAMQPNITSQLFATSIDGAAGGIRFSTLIGEEFMDNVLGCMERPDLWDRFETHDDFADNCKIIFSENRHFGDSTVKIVKFTAHAAVPLYAMLWFHRELTTRDSEIRKLLGEVTIFDTNGLPCIDDWITLDSGLIKWN